MARKTARKFDAAACALLCRFLCISAILVFALPVAAADLAVLRNGFSIRHDHHQEMGTTTRLFFSADDSDFTDVSTADITGFEKDLTATPQSPASQTSSQFSISNPSSSKPSSPDLSQVVNSASAAYHLDPDLVNSVIHAESGFNARAVSPRGAQGLMQLMPATANTLGVNNAFDPQANVGGGSRYLRELLERYNFDLVKALAAYNAGPGRVEQYQGVPPFHETRAYVARIVRDYNRKKMAQEQAAKAQSKKESSLKQKKASLAPADATSKAPKHLANSAAPLAVNTTIENSPR